MKKILTLAVLCLAMLTTAQAEVPEEIQHIIDDANSVLVGQSAEGMTFQTVYADGNDVIFPIELDDAPIVAMGFSLEEAIEVSGGTEAFKELFIASIFEGTDANEDPELKVFKDLQYNLVLRIISSTTKKHIDIKASYLDF